MNEQTITRTCPRCGKVVAVSQDELMAHEGSIVCPQCLLLFTDSEVAAAARQVREALEAARQPATASFNYCPQCGQSIPHNINFCPYCGERLSLTGARVPAQPSPPQPVPQQAPPVAPPAGEAVAADDRPAGLQVLPYTFSPWLRTLKTPLPRPSARFAVLAGVVIAVEVVWLVTMAAMAIRL